MLKQADEEKQLFDNAAAANRGRDAVVGTYEQGLDKMSEEGWYGRWGREG